jgi:hypothetical protein
MLLPKRPMNAVSTKEASGSAANAREAGTAMRSTSDPSSSSLKTLLGTPVIQPNLSHQHKHLVGRSAKGR